MSEISGEFNLAADFIARGYLKPNSHEDEISGHSVNYLGRDYNIPVNHYVSHFYDQWWSALFPSPCSKLTVNWILQNPEVVKDKVVLDLAASSGIIAMAAAKMGAREAITLDALGEGIVKHNALVNGVADKVSAIKGNVFDSSSHSLMQKSDVIILCNFYTTENDFLFQQRLRQQAERGAMVVICANSEFDKGWNSLVARGNPIRPRGVTEKFFMPRSEGGYDNQMFIVSQDRVACG